ncbi:prophage tail fiber N-terminal domain-containing protein [Edwardsiella piscicida]|uniref:prophage tail fiber N-terminal domain-containing protein n=1 Tax=Edwardsiella piscicida TaxID=1263550 RepID=UPI00370D02B8
MARITGILKNGMGKPITHCEIALKALRTSASVIVHTVASQSSGEAGLYDMAAEPGQYRVTLCVDGYPPEYVGDIQIYHDSPDGTLNYFLGLPQDGDLRPDVMKEFEVMVAKVSAQSAEVEKNRDATAESARAALDSQNAAHASESAVAASASAALASQNAAKASELAAASSAETAATDAAVKAAQATEATLREAVRADADRAASSATEAHSFAEQAAGSASGAHNSQTAAAQSASQAAGSSSAATGSASAAKASETAAAGSASSAAQSVSQVSSSASAAAGSASAAKASETAASGSASAAAGSAQSAKTEADRILGKLDTKQDKAPILSAIAALPAAANKLSYFTGADRVGLADFSQVGRDIVGAGTANDVIQYLKLGNAAKLDVGITAGSVAAGDTTMGGSYTNVTSGRVMGVTYTNSSTRSMLVIFSYHGASWGTVEARVGGAIVARAVSVNNLSTHSGPSLSFIVPSGETYSVTKTDGAVASIIWSEMV